MSRKKSNNESASNDITDLERQKRLAVRAAREAVQRLNIPEVFRGEYRNSNQRWNRFYQDFGDNIVLGIELNPLTSTGIINCSLGHTVLEILADLEKLLAEPKAKDLFEITDPELDEFVFKILVDITAVYLDQLPITLYHAFYQAVDESIVSHVKTVIEPLYIEDWINQGKPKEFSLLPTKRVGDLMELFPDAEFHLLNYVGIEDSELNEYGKAILSKRGLERNPERMKNLHLEYDQLRAQFKQIKKEFDEQRQAYFRVHLRASESDWNDHWKSYLNENFPLLHYGQNDVERPPSELAYRYLSAILEYHPDTVETKVRQARALAKERSRTENIKLS